MKRTLILLLFVVPFVFELSAQKKKKDPVLFTVDGVPVHVSEFNYIYTKTNADKADYSKASVDEYLDLYKKFKLKVRRAKEMQLDTIPSLIKELDGYRRQLADSYLIDKEVTNKLIDEVYERQKKDIDIGHIMVAFGKTTNPADTMIAYKKITEAQAKIVGGANWEDVAMEYSDDNSKAKNKGRIGFVTAMFPNGFYALENASYTLKKGKLSKILRTKVGYHLVKVFGERPARGEIEVAHILARVKDEKDAGQAKAKIDAAYKKLQSGATFEAVAKSDSDDQLTAAKGGYIGFFGINRYDPDFENSAFAIKKDGDYSAPIKSNIGYHIIKRVSRRGLQPLKIVKSGLQSKVKKDGRFTIAQRAMVERIKREGGFKENMSSLNEYITHLDSNFLTFKWKPTGHHANDVLFSLGSDYKATVSDFEKFLSEASRQRISGAGTATNEGMAKLLYGDFVNKECLGYEERNLEAKYPDFKALMREYEEGILLFEATKIEVWDKASQDTTGLAEFFKTVDGKYKWEKRAAVSLFSLKDAAKDKIDEVRAYAKTNKPESVLAKFNSADNQVLTVIDRTFERGRNDVLDKLPWEVGTLSANEPNKRNKSTNFMKIEEILPPGNKSLKEARGYVVADYQDQLEKEWIAKLRQKFPIKVNKKTYKKLIKKKGKF